MRFPCVVMNPPDIAHASAAALGCDSQAVEGRLQMLIAEHVMYQSCRRRAVPATGSWRRAPPDADRLPADAAPGLPLIEQAGAASHPLDRSTMLAVYVSGHGFGHSTRTAEVLRELRAREPALPITIVTSAPAFLFEGLGATVRPPRLRRGARAARPARDRRGRDARPRAPRSRSAGRRWWSGRRTGCARPGARLVLGDIPPLAFAAAHAAGVPSVGLGNFSWDWIYRELARGRAGDGRGGRGRGAGLRRRPALLLELPFAGDLAAFPRRERIPMVARAPVGRTRRRAWSARPGARSARRPVLVRRARLRRGRGRMRRPSMRCAAGSASSTSPTSSRERLRALGLLYQDVVGAVDVVVTKPGYGIVTDAIAAGTRLVYTDRGDFPEYPILVEEMARYLPVAYVSGDDLRARPARGRPGRVLVASACRSRRASTAPRSRRRASGSCWASRPSSHAAPC